MFSITYLDPKSASKLAKALRKPTEADCLHIDEAFESAQDSSAEMFDYWTEEAVRRSPGTWVKKIGNFVATDSGIDYVYRAMRRIGASGTVRNV